MCACILRISGDDFSASDFLRGSNLQPYDVEADSFALEVSSDDELLTQIEDAIEFLNQHFAALESLPKLPVEAVLDFSMFVPSFHDFPAQFLRWPAELLLLAGSLGMDIELSQYAVSDEKETL